MGNFKYYILIITVIICQCIAPPVTQNKDNKDENNEEVSGLEDYMEYHRYLKEVVNALESDPDFRKKLEKADENEIKSGKIAEQLEFVSHHVRTRLDEIKRVELERLKQLTEKKRQLLDNTDNEDPTHHHLDHSNPHTFEIEDLKKLIAKTTQDLAEADKKRREEFKQYEMQKEFEKMDKLNHTNGEDRQKLEKELKEMEEKHKKHEKLHEPGHKAQLEEVWEEQDQMQQDFDPKTFFMLHDLDGNGLWDQDEVKALFIRELDKMYQQGAPEDDMRERAEEMERMRETVFMEVDRNKDGFIDYDEFYAQTKRNEFKQDHGWQGLDEQKPYTDEELAEYIRQHQANQIPHGYPPQHYPPPPNYPPPGQGYYGQPMAQHPNAVPHPNQPYQHPQAPQQAHPNDINSNAYGNHPPPQNYQQQQQQVYHPPPQPQAANINYQRQPNAAPNVNQQPPQQQQNYQQNVPNQVVNQQNVPNQGNYQQNAPNQVNYQQNVPNNQQNPHGNSQSPPVQQNQQPNLNSNNVNPNAVHV